MVLSSFSSSNNLQEEDNREWDFSNEHEINTFLENKKESKIIKGNIHGSRFSRHLDGRFHGSIKGLQNCIAGSIESRQSLSSFSGSNNLQEEDNRSGTSAMSMESILFWKTGRSQKLQKGTYMAAASHLVWMGDFIVQ